MLGFNNMRMPLLCALLLPFLLVGCSDGQKTIAPKKATSRPYVIKGKTYYPQEHYEYDEEGTASYYGIRDGFHGKKTATGELYDAHKITAAHKTLPLPSVVLITNLDNGRSLTVKVNDRGPFPTGRIIDVSEKCAQLLGFYNKGLARVRVQTLVEETLALQKNPHAHQPVMMASAGERPQPVSNQGVLPPPQRKQPQIQLASAKPIKAEKMIKNHPGMQAVGDLINPHHASKPQLNKDPRTSLTSGVASAGYFIRAGTFSRMQNAEKLSNKLKPLTQKVPVRLNTVAVNNKPMYMVKIGPFKNTEQAQQLVNKMAKAGHRDVHISKE